LEKNSNVGEGISAPCNLFWNTVASKEMK